MEGRAPRPDGLGPPPRASPGSRAALARLASALDVGEHGGIFAPIDLVC